MANKAIVNELTMAIHGLEIDNLAELYPELQKWCEDGAEEAPSPWCEYDFCPVSTLLVFYVFSHHALVGGDVRIWMGLRQHRRGSEGQEDHIWYYCWWHPTELYASGVAGIMGEQIPNRFEVYAKFCQMDYLGGKLTGGCWMPALAYWMMKSDKPCVSMWIVKTIRWNLYYEANYSYSRWIWIVCLVGMRYLWGISTYKE